MDRIVRLLAVAAVVSGMCAALIGCNTVKGVGKDIKRGGQAVENAADRVQN